MAAVAVHSDFGAQENKSVTVATFSPSICHEVMGPDAVSLDCQCTELSCIFLL